MYMGGPEMMMDPEMMMEGAQLPPELLEALFGGGEVDLEALMGEGGEGLFEMMGGGGDFADFYGEEDEGEPQSTVKLTGATPQEVHEGL